MWLFILERSARDSYAPSQKSRRHNSFYVWTKALYIHNLFDKAGLLKWQRNAHVNLLYINWIDKYQNK